MNALPNQRFDDLLERARGGDRDAFSIIAATLLRDLNTLATYLLRNRDDAKEAVQEALINIWVALPSLREPDKFHAWARTIVRNECRRRAKQLAKLGEQKLDDRLAATLGQPEKATETRELLREALSAMNPLERRAFELVEQGWTYDDIAAMSQMKKGTLYSAVCRGKKRALKRLLESLGLVPATEDSA